MPAAAVIPAPIAYINVVAVEKLVVELLVGATWPWAHALVCRVSCLAILFFFGRNLLL